MKSFCVKKALAALLSVLLAVSVLAVFCGCEKKEGDGSGKLRVVATLFVPYDFARIIGGDLADVSMLLPFGTETHTYDPSVKDIAKISSADLFFYTGDELEVWAKKTLDGAECRGVISDLSEGIVLLENGEEEEEEHHEEEGHSDLDSHIWTSPKNALLMAHTVLDAYCNADPVHKDEYWANAEKLFSDIASLDRRLEADAGEYDGRTVFFGGRFAFRYLFEEYGFNCASVLHGCSEESEPSIRDISEIASRMMAEGATTVFAEESGGGRIASSLSEETGAEVLILHSCHNISADEAKAGESYISIMDKNIDRLETALFGEKRTESVAEAALEESAAEKEGSDEESGNAEAGGDEAASEKNTEKAKAPLAALDAAGEEAARAAAGAYYGGTVFEVVSLTLLESDESHARFESALTKGGKAVEPNREIVLEKIGGEWIVVGEGY